ncbi:3-oxoacyl-ACP synthase [Enterovibrio norvegicus]|nr:3-oxoacyl-ACP synthase [Enterovibrio norvegicus]
MHIRLMTHADLPKAAAIHHEAFVRQQRSYEWLECNLNAAPRFLNFVAESDGDILGFITWTQKSGFRADAVLDLELLAVASHAQGKGVGRSLIEQSLPQVRTLLAEQGSTLKHIMVNTRADNFAQTLYKKTLGAEVEVTIPDLYSADEVIMIARYVDGKT